MVKQRLGVACLYYTVDKGIAGGAQDTDQLHGYTTRAANQ